MKSLICKKLIEFINPETANVENLKILKTFKTYLAMKSSPYLRVITKQRKHNSKTWSSEFSTYYFVIS